MDMPVDASVLLPAAFFTLVAVIVAAVVLGRKESPARSSTPRRRDVSENTREGECELSKPLEALRHSRDRETNTGSSQEQLSAEDTESQSTAYTDQDREEKLCKSQQMIDGCKDETAATENDESASIPSVQRRDHEQKPLKYMPGMLRTSQLEKMMSKEELDEERR
ncbi:hypothetical protein NFI96_034429 [Prochilodus magdalenae]|nr:hypothetical protein NFI96_034429 [Prochilodus magdalenae]